MRRAYSIVISTGRMPQASVRWAPMSRISAAVSSAVIEAIATASSLFAAA